MRAAPRVLALTSLYPSPARPGLAAFNRQQVQALSRLCPLSLVAPVPFLSALPALLRRPSAPAPTETFPVRRPIFWYLPGLQRQWHGRAFLLSVFPALRAAAQELRPEVLLATWLYPDAWAGLLAARRLGLPLVVKLHGSDLLSLRDDPARRPYLRQVLAQADRVVAVSQALAETARELGAPAERLRVVPNGVDQELFHPGDRQAARQALGLPLDGSLLLFVGRLVELKGPDIALAALAQAQTWRLALVGDGPMAQRLRRQATCLGLGDRVIWAGEQPHAEIARWLAASDGLILPSRSEGEPNVALEALAAGRPVAAAAVGGVPEVIQEGMGGCLTLPQDPNDLARAMDRLLSHAWEPTALRALVAQRSWPASAARLLEVLVEAAGETR